MASGIFLVLSTILLGITFARQIPDFIHVCKRNDPRVEKCVQTAVEELRPRLKAGIPELDVPSLEPLNINNIVIANGGSRTNFRAVLQNVNVYGANEFKVTKLKVDVPNFTYSVGITFTHLRFLGNYDVDAQVLVVPIKGHGKFYANASNCEAFAVLKGELINRGGTNYMHFTSLKLDINIADYSIHLENLFEGDAVLGQAANQVLNENKQQFLLMAKPFIEAKASEILLEDANKIVKNFPYDDLFPEK